MPWKEGKRAYHAIREYIHKETGRATGPSGSAAQDNSEGHLGPVPGDGRARQGGGSRELMQLHIQKEQEGKVGPKVGTPLLTRSAKERAALAGMGKDIGSKGFVYLVIISAVTWPPTDDSATRQ